MEYIRLKNDEPIWEITLARPDKRNALNHPMVSEIHMALKTAASSTFCRAVIIKAEGEAFCAGADLQSLQLLQANSYEENLADSNDLAELFKTMNSHPKLIITQVNGPALAGGCGLATISDYCFASHEATFGYTEARIGFVPAIVMVFLLRRLGEQTAREWMLSADIVPAEEAKAKGLIYSVSEGESLNQMVYEFVSKLIKRNSGESVKRIKEMMSNLHGMSLDDALTYASEMNARTRETDDCKKGITAFLNKERPDWI
jgi:methylglutaconyl-CoA hydratase